MCVHRTSVLIILGRNICAYEVGFHLRNMWHQSQLHSHELNPETSFIDIFLAILVLWSQTVNYVLLWLKIKMCLHFTCWWSGNASLVWNVISFCGECSRLFPIFSTFSSVSTYFLTAFLSSHDPEKFSVKFFLAFCNRAIIQTKFSTVCSSLSTHIVTTIPSMQVDTISSLFLHKQPKLNIHPWVHEWFGCVGSTICNLL